MATIIRKVDTNNLQNFQTLIDILKTYGQMYRPFMTYLQIPQLEELLAQAKIAVTNALEKKEIHNNEVKAQKSAFDHLQNLTKEIVWNISSCEHSKYHLEMAKALQRKIQGKLALSTIKKHKKQNPDNKKLYAGRKVSYLRQVEHFSALLYLVKTNQYYKPNKQTLDINNLNAFKQNIAIQNNALTMALSQSMNATNQRDTILYDSEYSIFNVATNIKQYTKGAFGTTSQEYNKIKGIKFTKAKI